MSITENDVESATLGNGNVYRNTHLQIHRTPKANVLHKVTGSSLTNLVLMRDIIRN